jgi:very-short-patch-repair endonuclease
MKFNEIRKVYADHMPSLTEQYKEDPHKVDPYIYDWASIFTPIEESMWSEIRAADLPMFPQLPVFNYFLDFANPFVKVAIECDGSQWHDAKRDAGRDKKLREAGWTVYRVPGKVCNRVLLCPAELKELELDETELANRVHDYLTTTARSVVFAIKRKHFEGSD